MYIIYTIHYIVLSRVIVYGAGYGIPLYLTPSLIPTGYYEKILCNNNHDNDIEILLL